MGLKDQRCFWSNRFSDSDCLASLRAFASELSAESLVALAADYSGILNHIFATFSVSCHVVKLRRIRLLRPVPIVGNETNRTAHVAALKSCSELLLPEVLPAGGTGTTGCHYASSFFHYSFVACGLVPGGGGCLPSLLPHQRKNPTRLNMSPASLPPPLLGRGHTSGKRDSLASSSPLVQLPASPARGQSNQRLLLLIRRQQIPQESTRPNCRAGRTFDTLNLLPLNVPDSNQTRLLYCCPEFISTDSELLVADRAHSVYRRAAGRLQVLLNL